MKYRFIKWFEMTYGWVFIKPKRRVAYAEFLRKKYGETK
jgi:hypothetical protein